MPSRCVSDSAILAIKRFKGESFLFGDYLTEVEGGFRSDIDEQERIRILKAAVPSIWIGGLNNLLEDRFVERAEALGGSLIDSDDDAEPGVEVRFATPVKGRMMKVPPSLAKNKVPFEIGYAWLRAKVVTLVMGTHPELRCRQYLDRVCYTPGKDVSEYIAVFDQALDQYASIAGEAKDTLGWRTKFLSTLPAGLKAKFTRIPNTLVGLYKETQNAFALWASVDPHFAEANALCAASERCDPSPTATTLAVPPPVGRFAALAECEPSLASLTSVLSNARSPSELLYAISGYTPLVPLSASLTPAEHGNLELGLTAGLSRSRTLEEGISVITSLLPNRFTKKSTHTHETQSEYELTGKSKKELAALRGKKRYIDLNPAEGSSDEEDDPQPPPRRSVRGAKSRKSDEALNAVREFCDEAVNLLQRANVPTAQPVYSGTGFAGRPSQPAFQRGGSAATGNFVHPSRRQNFKSGCHQCGSVDHYRRDCPKAPSAPTARVAPAAPGAAVCLYCRSTTHGINDCPVLDGLTCTICGQSRHTRRNHDRFYRPSGNGMAAAGPPRR